MVTASVRAMLSPRLPPGSFAHPFLSPTGKVVLSVKRADPHSTTGALNLQAAARGELPVYLCVACCPCPFCNDAHSNDAHSFRQFVPPAASNAAPQSWRQQLEQESLRSASSMVQDTPTCRICHADHNGPGDDRLFSPCLCRGSMRFVHVSCLNRCVFGVCLRERARARACACVRRCGRQWEL